MTWVTCKEAEKMTSGINVQGRIVEKGEVITRNTKHGETKVCNTKLVDDSGGSIALTLWGEDGEKVKNGDMVSLEGGYTTKFRNKIQLNKDRRNGKLEVIQKHEPNETPPPETKLCKHCGRKIEDMISHSSCNRKTDDSAKIVYSEAEKEAIIAEETRKKQKYISGYGGVSNIKDYRE